MNARPSKTLLQALAVTAELTGTAISEDAARMMAEDLGAYPVPAVLLALTRCRRELKHRLTVAEIIGRIDDGRPGPEEAWAMIPVGEEGSVVWSEDMAQAFGVCWPLLREGDRIGARMAFKETYLRIVADARAAQVPVKWTPSLGRDVAGREVAIDDAVSKGRMLPSHAQTLLPNRGPVSPMIEEMAQLLLERVRS